MPKDIKQHRRLEDCSVDFRLLMERAYRLDAVGTHRQLVHSGYWHMAAQLKIDHAAGRLDADLVVD